MVSRTSPIPTWPGDTADGLEHGCPGAFLPWPSRQMAEAKLCSLADKRTPQQEEPVRDGRIVEEVILALNN